MNTLEYLGEFPIIVGTEKIYKFYHYNNKFYAQSPFNDVKYQVFPNIDVYFYDTAIKLDVNSIMELTLIRLLLKNLGIEDNVSDGAEKRAKILTFNTPEDLATAKFYLAGQKYVNIMKNRIKNDQ